MPTLAENGCVVEGLVVRSENKVPVVGQPSLVDEAATPGI